MAIIVLLALLGGAIMGRCARVTRSLAGVAGQAVVVVIVVASLVDSTQTQGMTPLLAIAAGMFSLVIGTAATLLTRRVLRDRRASPI